MKSLKHDFFKSLILFLVGGVIYLILEILWRGYTHWTMGIVGGFSFICVGLINELFPMDMYMEYQACIASIMITVIEFISGCIINIKFGLNVWDYSMLPFNIEGQVCLLYTALWYWLSMVAIVLDDGLRYKYWDEEPPKYKSIVYDKIKPWFYNRKLK